MSQFAIRFAQKEDAGVILSFIQGIALYEKLSHEVEATTEKIEHYLFGEKAFASCLLAFEDDIPVGFALYFNNYSTFVSKPGIYLEDLFVDPTYLGKEYGKQLLLQLVKIAKENNYGRVEWSVLDWNQPAIDFYESLGAKPMNGWTVYRLNSSAIDALTK